MNLNVLLKLSERELAHQQGQGDTACFASPYLHVESDVTDDGNNTKWPEILNYFKFAHNAG